MSKVSINDEQLNESEEDISEAQEENTLKQRTIIAHDVQDKIIVKKEEQMKIKENKSENLEEVVHHENDEQRRSEKSVRSEKTVICSGTTISGDIKTDDDLEIYGSVEGNIECNAQLKISGKVIGNILTGDLYLDDAEIIGNLNCSKDFENTEYTAVTGDIHASVARIGGRVKGNVIVEESLILDEHAVIIGNITTAMIEMRKGAVINGSVTMIQGENNSAFVKSSE